MFEVKFHDEAEQEFLALPTVIREKISNILKKAGDDSCKLREPDTKPLGNGLFEVRTMGGDIDRGLWVYQSGSKIYLLRIFVKKRQKNGYELSLRTGKFREGTIYVVSLTNITHLKRRRISIKLASFTRLL